MGIWSRRRQQGTTYVTPPEGRAGLIVLFDGTGWRIASRNAGDGAVPPAVATSAELTGERLADEFRTSWVRAREGAAPAAVIEKWIQAVHESPLRDYELNPSWERFFTGGGAIFRVAPSPRGGVTAMRYVWVWPLTGNRPVSPSDKTGDQLVVFGSPGWHTAVEEADAWRAAEPWSRVAAWMRDRAPVDPRMAAWWVADQTAAPRGPVLGDEDGAAGLRSWWTGDWYPTGVPVVERYGLPEPGGDGLEPGGDGFWYAWLRWDPSGSPRPDGLADVLGLRRSGQGVDVVWWPVRPDGTFGDPVRAVTEGGGPLHIDRVEELVTQVLVLERQPSNIRWIEAMPQ